MKLRGLKLRGVAVRVSAFALAAAQFGCNSILGIDAASGIPEGGTSYVVSCSNYCNLMQSVCNSSQALSEGDNTEYLSSDVCMQICGQFDVSSQKITASVDPNPEDSLNCRVWHANAALQIDPHTHCPHAGPLGGRLCDTNSDPCPTFCHLDLQFCTGQNQAYASYQDCLDACEPDAGYTGYVYELNTSDNEVTDLASYEMTDTLNCRMYHLENFLFTQQSIHCSHTSLSGNGVCVGTPPDL
jgi:hypothetical protein